MRNPFPQASVWRLGLEAGCPGAASRASFGLGGSKARVCGGDLGFCRSWPEPSEMGTNEWPTPSLGLWGHCPGSPTHELGAVKPKLAGVQLQSDQGQSPRCGPGTSIIDGRTFHQ